TTVSSIGYIRAGRLRALAVTTATRSDALPDIPTVGEFVPGYEASAWYGVGVPKNTPAEIVDKLNEAINAGLADPTKHQGALPRGPYRSLANEAFLPPLRHFFPYVDTVISVPWRAKECCIWELLDELLAGGQRQKEYSDFVDRYEQGHPSQGYSDQEVLKRYGEVSHAVQPDQYAQAAQEALSKLSPEERAMFVKMLQDRAAARGVTLPRNVAPEPKELGEVLTDLHKKPGQLPHILARDAIHPRQP